MANESNENDTLSEQDDLLIIELDERLEFGVAVIESGMHPDVNTTCQNGTQCTSNNYGTCINAESCQ